MSAISASLFILSGISLWLLEDGDCGRICRFLADACAFLVAFSGILTLAWHLFGWHPDAGEVSLSMMTPDTAMIFALAGGSMLLVRRGSGLAASGMAVAAGVMGILGLMGYAYEVEALTHIASKRQLSFHSVVACMVLATGILAAMKDRGLMVYLSKDGTGSVMARMLLPAVIFVPVLFGLIRHWGGHFGQFDEGAGDALMVGFSIITLSAVVWWNAVMLNRSHRERVRGELLRARQEKELESTANLLEKIFSNIHLKVAYMDPEFNLLRVNQTYADSAGHPPEYFVGRNHFDLFPHEENEEIFRRVAETGEPFAVSSKAFEYPEHPEWGTTYWDWSLTAVKGMGGTVNGLVLTLVDVTERVRAEVLLREKEEADIQQEKMALLGVMAAGIAHEVRNPLSGLNFSIAAAETVCTEAEELSPENRDVMVRTIASVRTASAKIGEVIRRVMDFAKPGRIELRRVNVNVAVREAVDMVSPMFRKSGIGIGLALSADLPPCKADLRLIEQLLLNLINNAAQAMEKTTGEKRIEVSSRKEGERVILSVADSGPGVSGPLREKIFTPFYTTRPTGTGLGLSISRRIVSDHGGTIEVGTSRFGGAEFLVSLPAQIDDEPAGQR
ncbi:MAG: PAS domain-containing protein [Deltaproteobacteria bacterium]|nr:PAS domain-containing protein [Deltaproteobacteria bacterium]